MKKRYFAPEIEEIKVEDPVVLDMTESSNTGLSGCPNDGCSGDNCPSHVG